jgi:FtsH-binding integral membrane protein
MKKIRNTILLLAISFISTPVLADKTGHVDCGVFSEYTTIAARLIMIISPILLIVLGTVDFIGAIAASDEKATSNFLKRLLICVIILILPILVNLIIGFTTFNDLTACFN